MKKQGASRELINRYKQRHSKSLEVPSLKKVSEVFGDFYFGGDPCNESEGWQGFIKNETLLVKRELFKELTLKGFGWGFVSGAEKPSAKFVLQNRLGLKNPPLIAMGDAPDKPDPNGFLLLAKQLVGGSLGLGVPPIAYLGDTVADVLMIQNARDVVKDQQFLSFAVAPPHLHSQNNKISRILYEENLKKAGADLILNCTDEIINVALNWQTRN